MLGKPALYIVLFVLQCSVDALKTLRQDSYTYTGVFTMKFNQHKVEAREKHKPETVSGAVWETPVCAEQFLGLEKQYRLTGERIVPCTWGCQHRVAVKEEYDRDAFTTACTELTK